MRNKILGILLLLALVFAQASAAMNVVIDAGHGGKDPGACGALTTEKALNLAVAQRLGKLLKDSCSDVKVYLTRSTDVFLTLQERANFVNKHNADLFICIHANASENKNQNGAETYTLGLDKLDSNFDVAKRENAVIMLEDNYQTTYQGFDPNSVESYIMFEFMQDSYLDKSLQFASLVQQQLSSTCSRADRGVRQAGFWVLHKSACPSVLVEMGFVSNPDEEKYLVSEQGKQQTAEAVFSAFRAYKAAIEKKTAITESNSVTTPKTETTTTPSPQERVGERFSPSPVFRVQIFSVTSELKVGDPSFKGLKGCKYTQDGRFLKYTYGEETDYEKIKQVRDTVQQKFKDCFITAFLNGEQILVRDAVKMADKQKNGK